MQMGVRPPATAGAETGSTTIRDPEGSTPVILAAHKTRRNYER